MCLIISKPSNVRLSRKTLRTCFLNNPHGAGYCFSYRGTLIVKKGFDTFRKFWKAYNSDMGNQAKKSNVLIHFRISTSGLLDENNCHPHMVNDDLCMVHNGILTCVTVPNASEISDTIIFIDEVIQKMPEDFLEHDMFVDMLGKYIGDYNKLAFMNNFGDVTIVNDYLGLEDLGCWFSNDTYEDYFTQAIVDSGKSKKVKYKTSIFDDDNYWQTIHDDDAETYNVCVECDRFLEDWETEESKQVGFTEGSYLCWECLELYWNTLTTASKQSKNGNATIKLLD